MAAAFLVERWPSAKEIDWLATPAMRVSPRSEPVASWGTLAQAARAAPDARLRNLHTPIDPWFAIEAWVSRGKGAPERVYGDR